MLLKTALTGRCSDINSIMAEDRWYLCERRYALFVKWSWYGVSLYRPPKRYDLCWQRLVADEYLPIETVLWNNR